MTVVLITLVLLVIALAVALGRTQARLRRVDARRVAAWEGKRRISAELAALQARYLELRAVLATVVSVNSGQLSIAIELLDECRDAELRIEQGHHSDVMVITLEPTRRRL